MVKTSRMTQRSLLQHEATLGSLFVTPLPVTRLPFRSFNTSDAINHDFEHGSINRAVCIRRQWLWRDYAV
jgi:hypothetical protein